VRPVECTEHAVSTQRVIPIEIFRAAELANSEDVVTFRADEKGAPSV
jgi:hypothetical protein